MSGEGGTSCEVELVSCSLSELSNCLCLHVPSTEEGSSRRKKSSQLSDIPPEDIFLSARRASLTQKPTPIDRLIYRNRRALIMGPKRSRGGGSGVGMKRKREAEPPSSSVTPAKKNRDDSSPTAPTTKKRGRKANVKLDPLGIRNMKKKFGNDPGGTNRYATRISSNKVRIPFSLRSGRKLADRLKKKRMRSKKSEIDPNSNVCTSDANGVDSENEIKVNVPAKKELITPKKVVNNKKEATPSKSPALSNRSLKIASRSIDNIKSAGSENTTPSEENDLKKKRKKRKRSSRWVNRGKRSIKKKESETPEDGDDFTDDDGGEENGRASDSSLLSAGTHDSSTSALPQSLGEGKPDIDLLKKITESERITDNVPIKEEMQEVKIKEEEQSFDEEAVTDSSLENKVVIQEIVNSPQESGCTTGEGDGVPCENAEVNSSTLDEALKVPVESDVNRVDNEDPPVLKEISSCVVESVEQNTVLPLEDEPPIIEKAIQLTDTEVDVSTAVNIIPQLNVKPDSPTPLEIQNDDHPLQPDQSETVVLPSTECIPNNNDLCDNLIITKCESLANTSVGNALVQNCQDSDVVKDKVMDDCIVVATSNVDDKVVSWSEPEIKTREPTQVPEDVPLREEVSADDAVKEISEVPNDIELRPDADSTTCDNPRGLDDSFGDLSLYVTEEDLSHNKGLHDDVLPDSTNISQGDIPPGNYDTFDEAKSTGGIKPIKTETLMASSFISPLKTEKEDDPSENLTEEQKQMKESVLHALGLKSLSGSSGEIPEEKPPKRSDGYTGTLKAVIKLNRSGDKKHMVYKRSEDDLATSDKLEYRICSEVQSDDRPVEEPKKLDSEPSEMLVDDETNDDETSKESNLIIPEKSSSFSIHPGRLCSDVCSYCFGKFGSLDTPCHVAQLKGEERQRKILENEPHLTGESCLCDACYRYVDRKANFPEKLKVGRLKPPAQSSVCCVTHCTESATRTIKRKWLIKLKKSITNKLNIDMEKLGHGVYYPFCTQHHYWVEYFTVCGICRKRLNRNNLFSLGSEADRLNLMLAEDGIPARLSVNLFLCKLCRYYADLRLKYPDPTAIPSTNQNFYKSYRRKILMSLDITVSDSDDELLQPQEESIDKKKKVEVARDDNKTNEDVMSLSGLATLLGEQPQQQARIQVKFGNVNIGTLSNLNIGQQGGSAASSSATSSGNAPVSTALSSTNVNGSGNHKNEPTYPEVSLIANFEYQGTNTPDGSWERYQSTLQFDRKTKQLWTELQRPYGSQTSFLRHLVMLERVWRDGYLVLAPDADEAASRYVTSARNRIRSFESQGPKMPTTVPAVTTAAPTPTVVTTTSTTTCATAPVRTTPSVVIPRKPQTTPQSFPFLTNTGEIEVTPIRANKPSPTVTRPSVHVTPPLPKPSTVPPQRAISVSSGQRPTAAQQQYLQQQAFQRMQDVPRKITPLDRAKSLVRMAPLYQQIQHNPMSVERRGVNPAVRFMSGANAVPHSSIPPLVRLPQTQPTQFYQQPHQMYATQHQIHQHHINQQQSYYQNQPHPHQRSINLPKLPKNLTVMSMPARPILPQAITLSHAGITIEKQIAPTRTPSLPIERPSISVFREPATP